MGDSRNPLRIPVLIELIKNNILDHGNPLALTGKEINRWNKDLNLPLTGEILFYTGGEYQLLPYLDSLTNAVSYFDTEGKLFSIGLGVRSFVNKMGISPEKVYGKIMSNYEKRYNEIPLKAAQIMQKTGLKICSLGDRELYSGALLHEFGYQAKFKTHAKKLIELIKETAAQEIVCLSPHSAEMFKYNYPDIDPWCNSLKVYTFIEYICTKSELSSFCFSEKNCSITIHDSCRMVRELGFSNQIRAFFNKFSNINIIETENTGCWTVCCGGPSKIMLPVLSDTIARGRINELYQTGADEVLVFCPYCLTALEKGKNQAKSKI